MGHTTENQQWEFAEEDDLRSQVARLQDELTGLRRALRTRATIEQAMGVLVVAHRCSPQQAFRVLVRLSQQHNIKLHRIAQVLVRLASRVEPAQIEPLLRRAVDTGSVPVEAAVATSEPEPNTDQIVLDLARRLVDAKETDEIERTITALYELLVERGWVPPYEVLAGLRVEA
ncbi:response regulator with putative antiterminator output domain [Saccharomonospora marina XMU15]|uniref:Response regulator with putative antiterminator output domain n=1 Tax=Saccharomonospora marina XMU15 TaxID=882083 RepID=H5X4J3_9PSEU|nr:ANTAR domain-containing protein [Saccharomonospora marina]EHR49997.1 response regulator with putative antiterminator output domain [Saccharomonospora marina XMU15]